jgi:hypothetical protein
VVTPVNWKSGEDVIIARSVPTRTRNVRTNLGAVVSDDVLGTPGCGTKRMYGRGAFQPRAHCLLEWEQQ